MRLDQSELLLNPKLSSAELVQLNELYKKAPTFSEPHLWIASSGSSQTTQDSVKLIALGRKALQVSAMAVNKHLQATRQDIWAVTLPQFHIGGFSIAIRADLVGAKIESFPEWQALGFYEFLKEKKVSLTSLVPTQVYDLVQLKIPAPLNLRAVIVGGGRLNEELYSKAQALGWPLLPSYGLTECCSQVATAELGSSQLKKLSHVELRVHESGVLEIQSPSLLTGYLQIKNNQAQFFEPVLEGWYRTEDLVEIHGDILLPLGRAQDYVKILGEGVHLGKLENLIEKKFPALAGHIVVLAKEHARRGFELVLVTEKEVSKDQLAQLDEKLAPFERIQSVQVIEKLPRSALGKVLKTKIPLS